jgi:hypothetical protein
MITTSFIVRSLLMNPFLQRLLDLTYPGYRIGRIGQNLCYVALLVMAGHLDEWCHAIFASCSTPEHTPAGTKFPFAQRQRSH